MYREVQVKRGIARLDEKAPAWREKFNPSTLDMFNVFQCVLGQAFGSYDVGTRELGLSSDQAQECGFTIVGGILIDGMGVLEAFEQLTATWRALVIGGGDHV